MLRKGSRVQAKLIEAIDNRYWIVSFQGQLIQVRNNTDIPFEEGAQLSLQVESVNPIQLKVLGSSRRGQKLIDLLA